MAGLFCPACVTIILSNENKLERFSFSKIGCYEQCPYQYYLKYIHKLYFDTYEEAQDFVSSNYEKEKKINEDKDKNKFYIVGCPDAGNAFSQFGGFVHEIMERYAKGELEIFELSGVYRDNFEKRVNLKFPPNNFVDLGETYYNDGLNFLNSFNGLDGFEVLGVEDEFEYEVEHEGRNFIFNGFIDLELRRKSDNKLICWDWKSKAKFKSSEERYKYARQLYLYSRYMKDKFGQFPDELWFGMFRKQIIDKIKFNQDDYEEAFQWLSDGVDKTRNAIAFEKVEDEFFCGNLCPYGKEQCGSGLL